MTSRNRSRPAVYVVAVLGMAAVILGRLYDLQVRRHEGLRARARSQHQRQIEVPATRGAILDREGRELAVSVRTASLYAHPWKLEQAERTAALLAPVLRVSSRELLERLHSDKPFVWLQRFLDAEQLATLRRLELPLGDDQALGLLPESRRSYPRGKLGVHVVGFANTDGVGVEGIELRYDEELRGEPTVYLVQQDARHGRLRELVRAPEREPRSVVLTLDLVLQHIVERELDRAMADHRPRSATAILLDPTTGELLALANRPSADPNAYGRSLPAERLNRALVNLYEPGSTFKIVPMAAALETGSVRPGQRIWCSNGTLVLGSRLIHDVTSHGELTLTEILEKSSNIGMVKVAQTLSPAVLHAYIERFGFGSRTGVELPGEAPGQLAPLSRWSSFTPASLAFGQEIGVTALQMATALAVIAHDGVLVPPRIVLGLQGADGRLERCPPPAPWRVLSAAVARTLAEMLATVVDSGTGSRAAVPGYRVAGKSGTAQKAVTGRGYSADDYIASFGGFGPVRAPRLVGLVVLDSPAGPLHRGGQVAAPVLGRILTAALRHLRVPPDEDLQAKTIAAEPAAAAEPPTPEHAAAVAIPAGAVPDVEGLSLRKAVAQLAARGYRAHATGGGFVREQRPAAGTPLAAGEICYLELDEMESVR
ncbi:MAG TPA: penicillin-binding transpeptidase domain-containing protein [Candidatus Polarisedimenticolaceae bacterium]|nr:penicillin-binding transpeptidase domain-containing protein [Candidatus Polarisedimenticolaceae bacterium]